MVEEVVEMKIRRSTNWQIVALLSMGFNAKDIVSMGYSSTAYKYQNSLIMAKAKVIKKIVEK